MEATLYHDTLMTRWYGRRLITRRWVNECALSSCDGPSDTLIRFVGALQLQVSFAKEPYKRDDILRCRLVMARAIH